MTHDLDPAAVAASLQFDPAWVTGLRAQWQALMATAVWDEVTIARLGAAPRLRKRVLELGERLRSLTASRDWIPHPRERLKSALAAALAVRETLGALDALLPAVNPGPDADRLRRGFDELRASALGELEGREAMWAGLLDAQVGA